MVVGGLVFGFNGKCQGFNGAHVQRRQFLIRGFFSFSSLLK